MGKVAPRRRLAARRNRTGRAYARLAHLYAPPQGDDQEAQDTHRSLLPVVTGYVIAIVIGIFVPITAVALYFGLVVYLVVRVAGFHAPARAGRRRVGGLGVRGGARTGSALSSSIRSFPTPRRPLGHQRVLELGDGAEDGLDG